MSGHRVVVTGIGTISALGIGREAMVQSLAEGKCGIGPITSLDTAEVRFKNAAEVAGYDPLKVFEAKELDLMDRFAQFSVQAALEAISDSGLEWSDELRNLTAVVTGSCYGGKLTEDGAFWDLYGLKRGRVNPMLIPRSMANAGASQITMKLGLHGPAWTVSTACSSANHAIGQAFWLVRNGGAKVAITGGAEAPFTHASLKAWEAIRVVSTDTCRPFSKDRKGMVLGEGAGMLVIETLESAIARGARIYAEIVGFGMSSDASHITMPSSDGAAMAMNHALNDAGVNAAQIGYINAHGTATTANDASECAAIHKAGLSHAAVSSTKSMHGHALGAAGALEAAATLLSASKGFLPPTANFNEPDPACNVDVIANQPREAKVEYALSNSFAFGGLNAVLCFRFL